MGYSGGRRSNSHGLCSDGHHTPVHSLSLDTNVNRDRPRVAVFLVLQAVHELLVHGRTATQRDLYYKLQRPPVIASSKDIDAAIQVQLQAYCTTAPTVLCACSMMPSPTRYACCTTGQAR